MRQAQAEIDTLAAQLASADPERHGGNSARLQTLQEAAYGDLRSSRMQKEASPTLYVPHIQQTARWLGPQFADRAGMYFLLRTLRDPTKLPRPSSERSRKWTRAGPRRILQRSNRI